MSENGLYANEALPPPPVVSSYCGWPRLGAWENDEVTVGTESVVASPYELLCALPLRVDGGAPEEDEGFDMTLLRMPACRFTMLTAAATSSLAELDGPWPPGLVVVRMVSSLDSESLISSYSFLVTNFSL